MNRFKRTVVLVLLAIVGTAYFWLSSRFPDLDAKSMMAQSATIADTLSPWPLFQVQANDSFLVKFLLTTINWINSNLKGMAFGIALGAVFLTLFSYFRLPNSQGRWRNTFYGFLLGSPLSVCVNCAAPVFKGILASKRIELAMATMLSSPTMNIVVLTMVFSLFPFYMGVIKILFTLICIFIGIPLISKLLGEQRVAKVFDSPSSKRFFDPFMDVCVISNQETWVNAIQGVFTDYGKRLLFMITRLVPLMILAGAMGAGLSLLLPLSLFASDVGLWQIGLAALFGVLLPVPIAFDVILVNAFYAQGMAEPIVLVLLCSLGIVSIFSMMVVWRSVSHQWAIAMMTFCFVLTLLVGLFAETLHQTFYVDKQLEKFRQTVINVTQAEVTPDNKARVTAESSNLEKISKPISFTRLNDMVEKSVFFDKTQQKNNPFNRLEGKDIGLENGFTYGVRDYTDPFWIGRGTAAGDYNKDGWPDILFGSNTGFYLYQNIGGRFSPINVPNKLREFQVHAVAFVDMDNNGWPDIFFSTFGEGNFVIFNHLGTFDFHDPISIPNNNGLLTISPAFADIDGNGLLDVINGNMALGVVTGSHSMSKYRNNSIVFNGGHHQYRDVPLENISGETMSTLVSDINNDGVLDIYFSNDFVVPDKILLGTGSGFKEVKQNELLDSVPFFSMSVDSADFNNDLKLDLLTTGTTVTRENILEQEIDGVAPTEFSLFKGGAEICLSILDPKAREQCLVVRRSNYINILDQRRNVDFDQCFSLAEQNNQQLCLLSVMWQMLTQETSIKDCDTLFSKDRRLRLACDVMRHRLSKKLLDHTGTGDEPGVNQNIKQVDENMLYQYDNKRGKQTRVPGFEHPGGWTWNAKFADLDNDTFQDVFNAEGAIRRSGFGWNVLLKNQNGKAFFQRQFSYGLTSDFGLFSFVFIDMDNDGDLDIIGNSAEGPAQVYKNNASVENSSIAIDLINGNGNKFGINSIVTIFYGDNEKQMREVKASGGYMSFDPSTVYFGLSHYQSIEKIEVRWPDKIVTAYQGPFSVNARYRLTRPSNP